LKAQSNCWEKQQKNWQEKICTEHGKTLKQKYHQCDDWLECIQETLYDDYVILHEMIFKVVKKEEFEAGDIYKASINKNGDLDFVLSFYNGGCCFSEALEEAIGGMEPEELKELENQNETP
jgi:hypothetical protein